MPKVQRERKTMKPYYQDKWVTIYHGNCREILPQLQHDAIDLVLTDPPYGMGYVSGHRFEKFDAIRNDSKFPYSLLTAVCIDTYSLLKPNTAIFLFSQWHILPYLIPLVADYYEVRNTLIWVKNNWSAGDLQGNYANQYEAILFATKGNFTIKGKRLPNILHCDRIDGLQLLHPTQKPEQLIETLILSSTENDSTILDPFLGSGTTAFCSKKLGRKCISIEIEETYCEVAANRCRQTVMELGI